jgi:hypothetical protein
MGGFRFQVRHGGAEGRRLQRAVDALRAARRQGAVDEVRRQRLLRQCRVAGVPEAA